MLCIRVIFLGSNDVDSLRKTHVSMEKRKISAIVFDLDNTLVDTAGSGQVAFKKVCELLKGKVEHANVDDICKRFTQKLLTEVFDPSGDRSIDEVRINHWQDALHESTVDPSQGLASDCYYTWKTTRLQTLALSPEVLALLEELRSSYKLLLLTNGDTQTQREKIEAVRCEGLFNSVVVGGEHAEQKPAASIFTHCFELLGVEPQDCVMVGDSLDTDVQGGFNAGVRATVWINKGGRAPPENAAKPDYTISSVLDLPNILADLK
ncbi:N-acylneuraminate-9-phosphatase [Electrophorus electricus]|uniref:N-acetylneuraminic acid phosphatase n=1 Tax=Electrophorus electricus TaxID=8005 RepID=A0A4W4EB09_ELEEL|nr:N-acylneuraminate-9-phosphatase [Electrophorus electricus]